VGPLTKRHGFRTGRCWPWSRHTWRPELLLCVQKRERGVDGGEIAVVGVEGSADPGEQVSCREAGGSPERFPDGPPLTPLTRKPMTDSTPGGPLTAPPIGGSGPPALAADFDAVYHRSSSSPTVVSEARRRGASTCAPPAPSTRPPPRLASLELSATTTASGRCTGRYRRIPPQLSPVLCLHPDRSTHRGPPLMTG
jgi:hypothetical protein